MTSATGIISFFAIVLFFVGILHQRMELAVASSSIAVIVILSVFWLADSFYGGVFFACSLATLGLGFAVIRMPYERMSLHERVLFPKFVSSCAVSAEFKPQGNAIPLRIFLFFEIILLFVLPVHFH